MFPIPHSPRVFLGLALCLCALTLSACNRSTPEITSSPLPATGTGAPSATQALIETVAEPTPTQGPMAARVNGEGISLADYQAELGRYQQAHGQEPSSEEKTQVLQDLIDQSLLAQGAAEQGFKVDEALLTERLDRLAADLGGEAGLSTWISANGYTPESFRASLARSLAAAWMRDQILAEVPTQAEQVHAIQILVYKAEEADKVLADIQAGQDFATLAGENDQVMGGELGWFPRGYLPYLQLEEAAFSLEGGKTSQIIETPIGFHLLQVLGREAERELDTDMRLVLGEKALLNWLETRRSQSQIEVLST